MQRGSFTVAGSVALALVVVAATLSVLSHGSEKTSEASSATAPASVASVPEPVASRGIIVFDMAHGQIFRADDTSRLGQSQAVEKMTKAGYEVRVNTEPITAESLEGVAAVYLAGPMQPFSADEETVIDDYLERGGTVVLSIHVPHPVMAMPARWGLPMGLGVMQALDAPPDQDPGIFGTESIVEDPVTEGVERIVVVSGWPITTDATKLATAKLVALAEGEVAADTNASGSHDPGDLQPPFGVVGVAPVGSGRVVVLGDDGILANIGLGEGDNAKLLDNILELISAPKGA